MNVSFINFNSAFTRGLDGISLIYQFYTVKLVHAVTSIKHSPVLKGHILVVLSLKISDEFNIF
jgi:hypothetical protein